MNFIITDTLANEILGYLGTKPFNEVAKIINQLAQIKPVPQKDEPPKEVS
jgi:hypothetical protein